MCAIGGILNRHRDGSEAMLKTMARRGPDERGIYREPDVTLLHSRLAIVDPSGGRQPMELTWAGRRYVLVYNGELYNTDQLRQELEALGHLFADRSDTAVVLHSFAQWGEDCLLRFNGIFAFALWNREEKQLFLARDRIGVKPLFYTLQDGGLVFASEIKTILSCPGILPELDEEGVAELLLLGPGRTPGSGVFRGIRELEPGCCGIYQAGTLRTRRYWRLTDREHRDNFEETAEKVRWLVTDAVRRQMKADVPVGAFLSGGLDSSLICSICARELGKEPLHTFSVDYQNQSRYFIPGKFQPSSDAEYIGLVSEFLSCIHHRTELTPLQLAGGLREAVEARDLPGMADVDSSLLLFCREVRKTVKAALSGECADEIFGGYPWYRDREIRDAEGFPWAQNTALRASLLAPGIGIQGQDYVMSRYRDTCRDSDILPGTDPVNRRMKEMVNLNFRWFMQTLLDRKDRMSMYSGLEVRVPFCDYRIAEYLYGVPWEMKDYEGREKGLLRYAMEGFLPARVLYRRKSPYPKTFDPAYLALVQKQMEVLLKKRSAPVFTIVDRKKLQTFLQEEASWPWYGQLMGRPQTIAYFLQLNTWLERWNVNILTERN